MESSACCRLFSVDDDEVFSVRLLSGEMLSPALVGGGGTLPVSAKETVVRPAAHGRRNVGGCHRVSSKARLRLRDNIIHCIVAFCLITAIPHLLSMQAQAGETGGSAAHPRHPSPPRFRDRTIGTLETFNLAFQHPHHQYPSLRHLALATKHRHHASK